MLHISIDHVYISHDVVFDESIFPFFTLHPNVRPHLCSEISLLPSSCIDPMMVGGIIIDSNHVPKSTDHSMHSCSPQVSSSVPALVDRSVLILGDPYLLTS
jgi:hypothetical protein